MYCKNCGAELEENAKFCGNCGSRVETESIKEPEYIPPVITAETVKTNSEPVFDIPTEVTEEPVTEVAAGTEEIPEPMETFEQPEENQTENPVYETCEEPCQNECIPHVEAHEVPNQEPVSQIPSGVPYAAEYVNPAPQNVNTTLWIILSALEVIICCGSIPGIIALIFAIIGAVKKNDGDFEGAEKNVKYSKIAFFIGLGLAALCFIVYIVLFSLGIISELY